MDEIRAWLAEEEDKRQRAMQETQAAKAALQARREPDEEENDFLPPVDHTHRVFTDSQVLIAQVCDEYKEFLIAKNLQYGDSAIHPVRIFSKATDEEQLLVRIDDKLSRLVRGNDSMEPDEDIMNDLLGYWILLQVVRRKAAGE